MTYVLPPNIERILHTAAWRKLSRQACNDEPTCWLKLPGCRGQSQTGDHVKPLSTHPQLALVRSNIRGACRWCNSKRANTPVSELPKLRAALEAKQAAGQLESDKPRKQFRRNVTPPALAYFNTKGQP
jgi:5-methylcytosine-specific restriction endonuclease McrA